MPTNTQSSPKTPRRPSFRGRKNRKLTRQELAILLVVVVLLGLITWGVLGLLAHEAEEQSTADESTVTAIIKEPVHEKVPENSYDSESFTTETDGTVTYTDTEYCSVHGIDVSSHQGEIDWTAVAEDGVEFAILRIGYRGYTAGSLNPDEKFEYNLTEAHANGIEVGVYFYSQAITVEEAKEEAEYVLSLLDGAELELAVFYDWEKQLSNGSRTVDCDVSILTDCALAFCQTIEEGGYDAGIYFYTSLALDTYDLTLLTEYTFWLSQPGEVPDFDHHFALWQYSYTGEVSGISTVVDLNILLVECE